MNYVVLFIVLGALMALHKPVLNRIKRKYPPEKRNKFIVGFTVVFVLAVVVGSTAIGIGARNRANTPDIRLDGLPFRIGKTTFGELAAAGFEVYYGPGLPEAVKNDRFGKDDYHKADYENAVPIDPAAFRIRPSEGRIYDEMPFILVKDGAYFGTTSAYRKKKKDEMPLAGCPVIGYTLRFYSSPQQGISSLSRIEWKGMRLAEVTAQRLRLTLHSGVYWMREYRGSLQIGKAYDTFLEFDEHGTLREFQAAVYE